MKNKLPFMRFFAALFLLTITSLSWAYDFEVDGIYYNKNSDGTSVTVTFKTRAGGNYSGSVSIPTFVTHEDVKYNVTSIGQSAFSGCSGLTTINIPESVTNIGGEAFSGCSGLTSITVASGNTKYDSRNDCNAIVETVSNTLIVGCKNTIIPNSVTSIGKYAFYKCSGLTSISIPNTVTSIGVYAFSGCSGLTSVTINSNDILYGTPRTTRMSSIFGEQVKEYIIGNTVTGIGGDAFGDCSGLTSITIPNSVTTIGNNAFRSCSGLTSITIPNSVTSIGYFAFSYCSGLTSITVASGNTIFDSRNDCNAIIATSSNILCVGCKETVIPNSVTSIDGHAFYGCSGLTSITIPNSVTSISNYAFYRCSGLTTINIPESVTSIGNSAFWGCSGLTSITIPNSVTSIGAGAFSSCNFRTIVSKPTQPNGFPDTFSQPEYNHTMLYVPQNSYWDYVFNSEWYRFLHIKEFAVDEVEARQAYMLADTDGTNFTVYNDASDKLVNKEYMHQVDETNLGSNWVAEPCGAGMALLNLGAEKYAQISNDGKITLSDTPQELDIEFNDGVATANGRQMMLVLNDDDDITDVVALRYTPSAFGDSFDPNAPIYDLMGRRLQQKPTNGYYIQGGKKFFVK